MITRELVVTLEPTVQWRRQNRSNRSTCMIDFHSITIADVWAALPEQVRSNPSSMERLQAAAPRLAVATYTDFFWEDNPDAPGRRRRSLPKDKLLSLMMRLYIHQGGTETDAELTFWQNMLGE